MLQTDRPKTPYFSLNIYNSLSYFIAMPATSVIVKQSLNNISSRYKWK